MPSDSPSLWRIGAETAREGYGLFLGNTISTIILAIGSIAIARLLGSEGYGLYSLSLTIPSILVLFTSLGIDQAVVKYASEYSSKQMHHYVREIFRASLLFKIGLGVIATTLLYISSDLLASTVLNRPYMGYLLKAASLLILFQTIYTLCSNLFVGLGKASLAGALATLQAIAKVSIIILLLLLGFGIWGAVFGHVFGYIVAAVIGSIITVIITRSKSRGTVNDVHLLRRKLLKSLIVYGLPLYGSTILAVMVSQYNNIVLANFASNAEIGSYAAAVNISTIILLVSTPIATVLYPSFSKVDAVNKEELPRVFELAVRYSMLLVAPTALFISTFSNDLVEIIYGESFRFAAPYLSLYALFYSLYPLLLVEISYFNGVGLPEKTFLTNLLILLLVLPFSPMLAIFLKVIGVITSIIVANLAAMGYATYLIIGRQRMELGFKNLAKIYVSAILSAAIASLFTNALALSSLPSLLLGGLIFILLYVTIVTVLGALDKRDYINLRGMLGGLSIIGRIATMIIYYMEVIEDKLRRRF